MNIAFVYAGGRVARLENARAGKVPGDFFFGAIDLERMGHAVSILDLNPSASLLADALNRVLRGWLPPRTHVRDIMAAGRLLGQLRACDVVVATTSGSAFALGFWKNLGAKCPPLVGIHCGAVNWPHHARRRRVSRALLLKTMAPVLFADNEAAEMQRQFGIPAPASLWFGVDEEFWTPETAPARRSGVLAVGNDGRRDYPTLLAAAGLLPDVPFRIVTRQPLGNFLPPHVEHIHGDWQAVALSDEELRDLYRASACVVVPLQETVQPSGQSVAMQAMMCGAPVVMTRTSGWWGADVLRSGEHLLEAPVQDASALGGAIRQAMAAREGFPAREALIAADWTAKGFAQRLAAIGSQASPP